MSSDPIRTRVEVPHLHITLPLTEKQAIACVVAADRFGVEPWEMAVHVLAERQRWDLRERIAAERQAKGWRT